MASTSGVETDELLEAKLCTKSRKCSKQNKHSGRCNTERKYHTFWDSSNVQVSHTLKRKSDETGKLKAEYEEKCAKFAELEDREKEITQQEIEANKLLEDTRAEVAEQEHHLALLKKQYDHFKAMLGQTQQARSKRSKNSTSFEMISDFGNSTRYRRRQETKDMLEYIHGSEEGAIFGAWDLIAAYASKGVIDKLISNYKRGKYLQGVFGKSIKDFNNSEDAIKQAVAMKYQNYLSRRKFKLVCKTQSSVYDADKAIWLPRNVKCLDVDVALPKIAGNEKVDRFVKSLDIGNVSQVTNFPGVSRTVTGLVFMILDLHLRLPRLSDQLMLFNGNMNHFIFQFSDDGAPETSELGMSIGSLTCWNFGSRVRSRELHYLLHCLSVSEKDPVMEQLWKQHADEMLVMEGNLLTVCGYQCTVEFQPSADQSWQSWANNELNQAATYPSPYANVHHGELSKLGGSIGGSDDCTWKPFTKEGRHRDLEKLEAYRKTLSSHLSETHRHKKVLEFMAANGLRQLGESRIRDYANLQRPEPMRNEINAWQHILNLIYKEALQRNCIDLFLEVLGSPVKVLEKSVPAEASPVDTDINSQGEDFDESSQPQSGCGLAFIVNKIREHYNDKNHRANNLSTRLIGKQAIALARHSYKLVDALKIVNESDTQRLKRLALGKAAQYLRNAGTLFNKVVTNISEINQLKDYSTHYFNLLALFFSSSVNITVWTIGYAIPYHSLLLFENYGIGLGIESLQAKESKHSGIKHDLTLTNRSKATGSLGKWWQVMRANYVRAFYLPEHQPMPSMYISHYESRMPSQVSELDFCDCGRKKADLHEQLCNVCAQCSIVLECASKQQLVPEVEQVVLPVVCQLCKMRFPDKSYHDDHVKSSHTKELPLSSSIDVKALSVPELKQELKKRGLTTTGTKDILRKRLEGRVAGEGS